MIKKIQVMLNKWGITDVNGHKLWEDGIDGWRTQSAILKAKAMLKFILK